ncbi:MAG: hypothetical protein R2911_14335 [Caldilineaceae bacterium]
MPSAPANADAIVNTYITAHPGCTVIAWAVVLTRFWRIKCQLSGTLIWLPAVIELKQAVLADELEYEVIGRVGLGWPGLTK